MNVRRRPMLALAVLLAVLGCLGGVGEASASPHSNRTAKDLGSPAVPGIRVQGASLLNNGVPWVPRGVQIVGLVAPPSALAGKYVAAGQNFGPAELQAAVAEHADLIRFQVSEFGVDPQGPLYSAAYVRSIHDAVEEARGLGLSVIVSLQAESPAGELTRCPLPDAGAERAWQVLAPMFAGDNGVMFELYNEPGLLNTRANWLTWLNGGQVIAGSVTCQAVGMQTLVNDIRADGADNVIILPGLNTEQTLAGVPKVTDPTSPQDPQFAYAVHYPLLTAPPTTWDAAFGNLAAKKPVILTEWNANSTTNCIASAPRRSPLLLTYLAGKRIGVVGFAMDLPDTLITDYSYTPTTYNAFTCGVSGGGDGQLLFNEFAAQALSGGAAATSPSWLVGAPTLSALNTLAPIPTQQAFNTPRTFVTGADGNLVSSLSLPTAVPTQRFTNEARLAAAVQAGALALGTQAVAYAPQHSGATPLVQQRNPSLYFQRAASIVHRAGLLFVAAPATNLVVAREPSALPAVQATQFLRLQIPAAAARYADAYSISPPNHKLGLVHYSSFVYSVASQASHAHPGVQLLAGLSTGAGSAASTNVLLNAVLNTERAVAGQSANVGSLSSCPNCNPPAAVAIALLGSLDGAAR